MSMSAGADHIRLRLAQAYGKKYYGKQNQITAWSAPRRYSGERNRN